MFAIIIELLVIFVWMAALGLIVMHPLAILFLVLSLALAVPLAAKLYDWLSDCTRSRVVLGVGIPAALFLGMWRAEALRWGALVLFALVFGLVILFAVSTRRKHPDHLSLRPDRSRDHTLRGPRMG